MLYRTLPKCNTKISAISFGTMRWPSEEACHQIMNHGLDLGLNYADCSTGYVSGKSQPWVARAIAKRRSQILISSKTGFAQAPTADEVRAKIEASLKDCGLDYFDFYQIWGLSSLETLTAALAQGGFVEGVRKAQQEGLIRVGLGFTFHGDEALFRAAIDSGEFVAATVSYNLMNRKEEANIAYAAQHGVGIVIMNPLAGGILALAGDPSLDFLRTGEAGPNHGALRFLHANPAISAAIVGFRSTEEVDLAVASLENAGQLTEAWRQEQMQQMDAVKLIDGQFCTGCGYCKECPFGFNPTAFMQSMRDYVRYAVPADRLAAWIHSRSPHEDAAMAIARCTECGRCEKLCPQHLPIIDQIRTGKHALGV